MKAPFNYYEYIQFYNSNLNGNHELRLYDIKYKHRRPVSFGLWFHTINRNGSVCRCGFRNVMEGRVMDNFTCVICDKEVKGEWGNNPDPIALEGECCEECNNSVVMTARLNQLGIG